MAYYYQPGAPVAGMPAQIATDKPGMYPAYNGHIPTQALAMPVQRASSVMAGAPIIQQGPPMPQPGGPPPSMGLAGASPSPLAAATPGASPLQPGSSTLPPGATQQMYQVSASSSAYGASVPSGMYVSPTAGLYPQGVSVAYQHQAPPPAVVASMPSALPVTHASIPTNHYMGRPIQPYGVTQPGTQFHAMPMVPNTQIGGHPHPGLPQPGLHQAPPPQPMYPAQAGFAMAPSMGQVPTFMYASPTPQAAPPPQIGALSSPTHGYHPNHIISAAPGLAGPPPGASFVRPPGGTIQ